MLKLVQDASARAEQAPTTVGLDELCRLAAQEMLTVALLAVPQAYLDAHADLVDQTGKRRSSATVTPGKGGDHWRR